MLFLAENKVCARESRYQWPSNGCVIHELDSSRWKFRVRIIHSQRLAAFGIFREIFFSREKLILEKWFMTAARMRREFKFH